MCFLYACARQGENTQSLACYPFQHCSFFAQLIKFCTKFISQYQISFKQDQRSIVQISHSDQPVGQSKKIDRKLNYNLFSLINFLNLTSGSKVMIAVNQVLKQLITAVKQLLQNVRLQNQIIQCRDKVLAKYKFGN